MSLKASEGCLIFTVGALYKHLFVELYAQTRRQSHSCSLSTPVMKHNAVVGFAQRGKLPERPCQPGPDLSFNNDADEDVFCVAWPHTEHTQVVTYRTVCTQTMISQFLTHTAVHFGYFRYSIGIGEERGHHFSVPCLISASTQIVFA